MFRIVSIAAAIAATTLTLGATAGHAQGTVYYAATPVAAPAAKTFLTRETIWKWRDGSFVANRGSERDAIVCSLVAQKAGKLSAFTAGGTAIDAAALEKCNAKAK